MIVRSRRAAPLTALGIAVLVASRPAAAETPPLTPHDLALINRLTWGLSDTEAVRVQRMGVPAWLQSELHPAPGDHLPPAVRDRIAELPDLHKSTGELAAEMADQVEMATAQQRASTAGVGMVMPAGAAPTIRQARQEVKKNFGNEVYYQGVERSLLRDLASADQLREVMTAFWFNHFNVFFAKDDIRVYIPDFEDQAIRPNALGNFRTLLEASLRSPAMMKYLDNRQNAKDRINENYARELMELHTLGVGSGYTQKDVQELARILTGCGLAPVKGPPNLPPALRPLWVQNGNFAFNPQRHDFGDKLFLGHHIRGSGFAEVEEALDILAAQPATARHVSRQIAQVFVSDQPPDRLVEAMAARFLATHGDIAAVLETMIASPEFQASLDRPLLKDPQHYVVSAVRIAFDGAPPPNLRAMANFMNTLGQPLYGHLTPDGYSAERSAWNGPGQIEKRFEIARQIGAGANPLFRLDDGAGPAPHPLPRLDQSEVFARWRTVLAPQTLAVLGQAKSPQEWNTLLLASPDFMGR